MEIKDSYDEIAPDVTVVHPVFTSNDITVKQNNLTIGPNGEPVEDFKVYADDDKGNVYDTTVENGQVIISKEGERITTVPVMTGKGSETSTKEVTQVVFSEATSSAVEDSVSSEKKLSRSQKILIISIVFVVCGAGILVFLIKKVPFIGELTAFKSFKRKLRVMPSFFSYARKGRGTTKFISADGDEKVIKNEDLWTMLKVADVKIMKQGEAASELFTPRHLVAHETVHFKDSDNHLRVITCVKQTQEGYLIETSGFGGFVKFRTESDVIVEVKSIPDS